MFIVYNQYIYTCNTYVVYILSFIEYGAEVRRVIHLALGPKAFSLLSLQLHTGRTHQIRAHCSHVGHPLFGDEALSNS